MLLPKSLYVVCSNSSVRARTFLCAKSKVRCFGGGESWVAGFIIEIVTINNMTLLPFFPRGTLNKFNTGRLYPKVQPLPLLYTVFNRKGTPFVYLLK